MFQLREVAATPDDGSRRGLRLGAVILRRTAVTLIALTLFVATAMFAIRRSRPILFTINFEPTSACPTPYGFANPFRDRSPEMVCESYLAAMRAGNPEALKLIVSMERIEHVLSREHRYPVVSWRLYDRYDDSSRITLSYWVKRCGPCSDGCEQLVEFDLKRESTRWVATSYSAVY